MEIRKWRGERPKAFFGIKAWPSASLNLENRKWKSEKRRGERPHRSSRECSGMGRRCNNPQRVGHPKAFFGIKARPPALSCLDVNYESCCEHSYRSQDSYSDMRRVHTSEYPGARLRGLRRRTKLLHLLFSRLLRLKPSLTN